ncbi:SDR family NAD(P)-dependent oxidoreductase [Rhodoplanes sp. Z2-YC6860]|uniref:SDR family NAD(P)-dependent oxidoreductase n=1 Tax=Rhodoplanes sp. Z2-YC6860 TaxID=674703 RepID=UPI00078BF104|nr:SDR family oxidoreductase [Rhodoplanes sp. Z2-YC6860]AMN39419.1 short-chain dehydrogenase/reductase SDR [Rhodoplanes sp. Z2-YC6860]
MDLGLKDRVAIVTGGNRGIGYAISSELLKEGAHVVVASLDPTRNADAIAKLKSQSNGRVTGVPTDLNDVNAVENLFKKTLAEFGRLDILINNATNISQGSFFAMTEEHWDRAFDNKLRGTVRCIRLAVPAMRERRWGRIVNISGGAAWTPQLGAITTGINNAAVQNLTVALANELGKDGILVNAVVPTAVRTERHDQNIRDAMAKTGQSEAEVLKPRVAKIPLGRMGTAEEIAAVVAFLSSERASFVNGSAWAVDGGVSARL